jgi:hypothetical protein
MPSIRETIMEVAQGLLAMVLVLGLGYGCASLLKVMQWYAVLVSEMALLGLVVLVAALAARKTS